MRGLIRGSESRGIVVRCVLLGVACVLVLLWIGCAPATPSSTTPSSSTGMYDPSSFTVDKAKLEEQLTYDAARGEYLFGKFTLTECYESFIRNMGEAESSTTVEERNKNLREADAILEVISYIEINYNKSVERILGGYIESGRIVEIEPNSGDLERLKTSGEDYTIFFMDENYYDHISHQTLSIEAKMLDGTVYIYPVNRSEGYINDGIGHEAFNEGIRIIPSGINSKGDTWTGGFKFIEDLYESLYRLYNANLLRRID